MKSEGGVPSPLELNEVINRMRFFIPAVMLFVGLIVAAVVAGVIYNDSGEILFAVGVFLGLVLFEAISIAVVWRAMERKLTDVSQRVLDHVAGGGSGGQRPADEPIEAEPIRFREALPSEHSILDTTDSIRSFAVGAVIVLAILLLLGVFFGFALSDEHEHNSIGVWIMGGIGGLFTLGALFFGARRIRILSSFHPGRLHLSRWPVRRHEPVEIHFQRPLRKYFAIREATATLRCVESASYSQGTTRVTATEVVREISLPFPVSISPGDPVLRGAWRITLPFDAPPSFAGRNNKIEWRLELMIRPEEGVEDDSVFTIQVATEVLP